MSGPGARIEALALATAALAAVVRLWSRAWAGSAALGDLAVLALVFPALGALGRPWTRGATPARVPGETAAAALWCLGLVADASLPLAVGGVGLAAAAAARLGIRTGHPRPGALVAIAVAGLPWTGSDLDALAHAFRCTGAAAVALLARCVGVDAVAQGALISTPHLTVSVDASCSGMATLQACVLVAAFTPAAGGAAYHSARVLAVAWAANVARLATLVALGLCAGPEVASGPAHGALGLAAMALAVRALAPGRAVTA